MFITESCLIQSTATYNTILFQELKQEPVEADKSFKNEPEDDDEEMPLVTFSLNYISFDPLGNFCIKLYSIKEYSGIRKPTIQKLDVFDVRFSNSKQ